MNISCNGARLISKQTRGRALVTGLDDLTDISIVSDMNHQEIQYD